MASHGKLRHLKRLAAPRSMPIPKKGGAKYLRKAIAGRHSMDYTLPLIVLLRDMLKLSSDRRETKMILNQGEVSVDGKLVKEDGFPLGLMDVVSIPKTGVHYRLVLSKGQFKPSKIGKEDASVKLCKIAGKKLVKGGRIQLLFHDGRTQLIEKEEDNFKVGDTVKLTIPKQQLSGSLRLEKGSRCYVYRGRHSGEIGVLEEIKERPGSKASDAYLKAGSKQLITRKDYLFVVPGEFKID